ncbi:MAG: trimethylamine methyltransferase family protein, partial [Pseudomonadota bacterium]
MLIPEVSAMNVQRARRGRRRQSGADVPDRNVNYRNLVNPFAPQPLYSDDQIDRIHELAKQVLAEIGIRALLPRARDTYRAAGCIV